mmetsp:Transcript_18991/g.41368  ORF Transcript_18991/g.41368 Transcript_18991/m.41368 type:complete len:296 (+) Transcript_18991:14-901(+)
MTRLTTEPADSDSSCAHDSRLRSLCDKPGVAAVGNSKRCKHATKKRPERPIETFCRRTDATRQDTDSTGTSNGKGRRDVSIPPELADIQDMIRNAKRRKASTCNGGKVDIGSADFLPKESSTSSLSDYDSHPTIKARAVSEDHSLDRIHTVKGKGGVAVRLCDDHTASSALSANKVLEGSIEGAFEALKDQNTYLKGVIACQQRHIESQARTIAQLLHVESPAKVALATYENKSRRIIESRRKNAARKSEPRKERDVEVAARHPHTLGNMGATECTQRPHAAAFKMPKFERAPFS